MKDSIFLKSSVDAKLRFALEISTILRTKINDITIRSAYFLIGALFTNSSIINSFYFEKGYEIEPMEILKTIITNYDSCAEIFGENFAKDLFENLEEIDEDQEDITLKLDLHNKDENEETDEEPGDNTYDLIKENVKEYIDSLLVEQDNILEQQEYLLNVSPSYSQNLYNAFEEAAKKSKTAKSNVVDLNTVIYFLLMNKESSAYTLVSLMIEDQFNGEISIDDLIMYIENNCNIVKQNGTDECRCYIPSALENCCEILNLKYKEGQKSDILGRDMEINQLWNIISKKTKRNAILIGEPGVGKTAIVEALTQQIVNKECPKDFYNYLVISFDIDSLVAGTKYRGEFESKIILLKDFINKNPNVILFIDEIHRTRGAGSSEGSTTDLSGALKPILSRDDAIIIGTTTTDEYKYFIESDRAYKRRFETIKVKEPKIYDVKKMVQRKVSTLENFHKVKLANGVLDYIISASYCFNESTANPDKTLDLCDRSMVIAKNENKSKVLREHVKKVFANSYREFSKYNEEDIKVTAYHEAAHFVISYMTGAIKYQDVVAISILPTSDALGVNVVEKNEKFVIYDKNVFLNMISVYLAGKAIEKFKFDIITSGPSFDLEYATKLAKDMITLYGMDDDVGKLSYGFDNNILESSESCTNRINEKVKKILDNQFFKVKDLIREHIKFIDMVAEKLLKDNIIVKKELEKLYDDYIATLS